MQIGKDIERYDWYYNRELISEVIIDRQNKEEYHNSTRICKLLNQQDQRIAELEEQLKNAIVLPKYEKGQKIYSISGEKILEGYFQCFNDDVWAEVIVNPNEIIDEDGYTDVDFDVDMFLHKNTFATKEEALAKLEELRGNDVKN